MPSFDLNDTQYKLLLTFLIDNDGDHIIKLLEETRDDEYVPPTKENADLYDYIEGSASEEEIEIEVDSDGFASLI